MLRRRPPKKQEAGGAPAPALEVVDLRALREEVYRTTRHEALQRDIEASLRANVE